MSKGGYRGGSVLERIEWLMSQQPEPYHNSTHFGKMCGLDESTVSRWRGGAGISLDSIVKIVDACRPTVPWLTIDWVVAGRTPDMAAYQLVERMASDVQDAVNRSLELIPDGKPLKLVRDDGPPPEPPDEDPSASG